MARRKAARQEAPQTIEQAVGLLAEYRDILGTTAELDADADNAIARIKAERDRFSAPLQARAVDIFRQLRAWWAVAKDELTEGKRKSIELAGVLIGERTTPPALQLPKGVNAETVIDELLGWFGGDYVTTTHKLDKQAIIKALRLSIDGLDPEEDATLIHEIGVLSATLNLSVSQKEEFFLDLPGKQPDPEIVAEPTAA